MVQGKKPRREEEKGMKSLMAFFTAGMMTAPGIASGGIVAGAAKLAITPDPKGMKVYLAGFGNNRVATGVHDDIWARGLVIGDGKKTIAIVGLDLIGLFWDDVQRIREKAKEEGIAVDYILVSSTHNHEGPDTLGLWGPSPIQSGINTGYQEFVISTAVRVLKEAISRLKPARIKVVEVDGPELYDLMNDGRIPRRTDLWRSSDPSDPWLSACCRLPPDQPSSHSLRLSHCSSNPHISRPHAI